MVFAFARTLARCFVWIVACIASVAALGTTPATAQPDSVRTQILLERGYPPDHSPRGALWRALAVPGWGQYYNRQYYKIPIVYAGLAGLGYAILQANSAYVLNRNAAIYAQGAQLAESGDEIPDVIADYQRYRGDYAEVVTNAGGDPDNLPLSARLLRSRRDRFRSRRDLSIIGTGLFYALTMTDAYVSAHLITFDVDEELALRVVPTGRLPASATHTASAKSVGPVGLPMDAVTGPGVSVRLTF